MHFYYLLQEHICAVSCILEEKGTAQLAITVDALLNSAGAPRTSAVWGWHHHFMCTAWWWCHQFMCSKWWWCHQLVCTSKPRSIWQYDVSRLWVLLYIGCHAQKDDVTKICAQPQDCAKMVFCGAEFGGKTEFCVQFVV